MAQNNIAIIADCDDTLAPDTTGQLLEFMGVDSKDFFQNSSGVLVGKGWDPSLAYMREMIRLAEPGGPLWGLTQEKIVELASQLQFYPGVPDCFTKIKQEIESHPDFRDVGVRVESYVVSGGIAELLRASSLQEATHRIWACDFEYADHGVISYPKNVISFTDKTRFLFRINKGQAGQDYDVQPSSVNQPMNAEEGPVPFENMIYVGDGPSDIPCMSLVADKKGFVIGVASRTNPLKTWALAYGRRANLTVDTDFTAKGFAYQSLRQAAWQVATSIVGQPASRGPVPQH